MTISASYPYNLQNGTTADATQVMADFLQIQNDVNANAAHNGANSDITSLLGLTTPLSIAQGGTGSTTASAARTALGLGAAAVENLAGDIIDGAGSLVIKSNVNLGGNPTTTTQAGSDSSTKIATTAQVQAAIAGKIAKIILQVFSSAGTTPYTPSANLLFSDIIAQGAGASGGSTAAAGGSASSGGGSGTFVKARATATQINATLSGGAISIVVGAGGAAPATGTTPGNNGTATVVTGLITAFPGNAGGANTSNVVPGGAGGGAPTISGGIQVIDIQQGQDGGDGANFSLGLSGAGGSCPLGAGGAFTTYGADAGAGKNGKGHGSGGSGAASGSNNTGIAAAGGMGADGYVLIIDYCSA